MKRFFTKFFNHHNTITTVTASDYLFYLEADGEFIIQRTVFETEW